MEILTSRGMFLKISVAHIGNYIRVLHISRNHLIRLSLFRASYDGALTSGGSDTLNRDYSTKS